MAYWLAENDERVGMDLEKDDVDLYLIPMRLCLDTIEPKYLRRLFEYALFPGFVGAICGKGGEQLLPAPH